MLIRIVVIQMLTANVASNTTARANSKAKEARISFLFLPSNSAKTCVDIHKFFHVVYIHIFNNNWSYAQTRSGALQQVYNMHMHALITSPDRFRILTDVYLWYINSTSLRQKYFLDERFTFVDP